MEAQTVRLRGVLLPNLKAVRDELSLSREQAAKRCGISTSQFWRLETLRFGANYSTVRQIESGLGVTEARLIGESAQ